MSIDDIYISLSLPSAAYETLFHNVYKAHWLRICSLAPEVKERRFLETLNASTIAEDLASQLDLTDAEMERIKKGRLQELIEAGMSGNQFTALALAFDADISAFDGEVCQTEQALLRWVREEIPDRSLHRDACRKVVTLMKKWEEAGGPPVFLAGKEEATPTEEPVTLPERGCRACPSTFVPDVETQYRCRDCRHLNDAYERIMGLWLKCGAPITQTPVVTYARNYQGIVSQNTVRKWYKMNQGKVNTFATLPDDKKALIRDAQKLITM